MLSFERSFTSELFCCTMAPGLSFGQSSPYFLVFLLSDPFRLNHSPTWYDIIPIIILNLSAVSAKRNLTVFCNAFALSRDSIILVTLEVNLFSPIDKRRFPFKGSCIWHYQRDPIFHTHYCWQTAAEPRSLDWWHLCCCIFIHLIWRYLLAKIGPSDKDGFRETLIHNDFFGFSLRRWQGS